MLNGLRFPKQLNNKLKDSMMLETVTNFNHRPTDRLYNDLQQHTDQLKQKTKSNLSEVEKTDLAERYEKALPRLWRECDKSYANDDDDDDKSSYYNAINKLSDCLYKLNEALPVGQEIRPKFSNKTFDDELSDDENFTFNGRGRAPNFAYCDMEKVTFINVDYSESGSLTLKGATFEECIFGNDSIFKQASRYAHEKFWPSCPQNLFASRDLY
jgi:hypothetical protein